MSPTRYFVPTDRDGLQSAQAARWPLPEPDGSGGFRAGATFRPSGNEPLVLSDIDALLEDLGERIFEAELVPGGPGEPDGARLVAETAWSVDAAARFALDCVEHIIGGSDELRLPNGASVAQLIAEARRYLDEGEEGQGVLQAVSRLALARRLRRRGEEVADVAFSFALEDESAGEDALDDAAWTAAASLREALLAAVEAIRHRALPRLTEAESAAYADDRGESDIEPEVLTTPWGNFSGGGRHGIVPAWLAAQQAAERARQAMADTSGAEAEAAERAHQRHLLAGALGLGDEAAG